MFPNVRVLPYQGNGFKTWKNEARPGDVIIIPHRLQNHSLTPPRLDKLLKWRSIARRRGDKRADNRIGVLHISNEVNRLEWPWYNKSDFVLRNYWTEWLPPHVLYIPLGGQVTNICPSETARDSLHFRTSGRDSCTCNSVLLKPAAHRRYLWSFIGSLRRGRRGLVDDLRKSAILDKGFLHVAGKFGGDGEVGNRNKDPKNMYLKIVRESQFIFCPCGNAMETHRIYEALNFGAIPVIENCSKEEDGFFPFRELVVSGGSRGMIEFVASYANDTGRAEELQGRVTAWWKGYITELAKNASATMMTNVPVHLRTNLR